MARETLEEMYVIASVHECGHAIGAIMLGLEVDEITAYARRTFFSGPKPEGTTLVSGLYPPEDHPDEHLIIAFCGMAAELCYYADMGVGAWSARRDAKRHAHGDMQIVSELLPMASLSGRSADRHAMDLIDDGYDMVLCAAEALRDSGGILSGDEMEGIL